MSTDDPLDLDRVDQEVRINELKEEARELAGDNMHAWENRECPPDIAEGFWRNVVAFEKAPRSCDFLRLEEMGVALPPPEDVSDAELQGKLREIFESLAGVSTFFMSTDHFSDPSYTHITGKTLCAKSPCSCRAKRATKASTIWSAAAARRTSMPGSSTTPTKKPAGNGPRISPRTSSPRMKRCRTTGTGICRSIRTIQALSPRNPVI